MRCLLLPSTQTCPLECPSQILPAIQDPSFHKQCLLIKETKPSTPERPQAAQICFSPPSCKFLHGLGFWKLGHIIFLSFPSVCLSVCLSNSFPHFSCKSKELFMIKKCLISFALIWNGKGSFETWITKSNFYLGLKSHLHTHIPNHT